MLLIFPWKLCYRFFVTLIKKTLSKYSSLLVQPRAVSYARLSTSRTIQCSQIETGHAPKYLHVKLHLQRSVFQRFHLSNFKQTEKNEICLVKDDWQSKLYLHFNLSTIYMLSLEMKYMITLIFM